MNLTLIADSIGGLFKKTRKVVLINEIDNSIIGRYKLDKESLPEQFNKPTVLRINGASWRVMKSSGERSHVILHVQPEDTSGRNSTMAPSLAGEFPETVNPTYDTTGWSSVYRHEWRQLELLPSSLLPGITTEIGQIDEILTAYSEQNALLGYGTQHIRRGIPPFPVSIPLDDFIHFTGAKDVAHIILKGDGVVVNGFLLSSGNHTYYGIIQNNIIQILSLLKLDAIDEELDSVMVNFNLILADWCNAKIIMSGAD